MALDISSWSRNSDYSLQAVQVTRENMLEVASHFNGRLTVDPNSEVRYIRLRVVTDPSRGAMNKNVHIGDWVTTLNGVNVKVYNDAKFREQFSRNDESRFDQVRQWVNYAMARANDPNVKNKEAAADVAVQSILLVMGRF